MLSEDRKASLRRLAASNMQFVPEDLEEALFYCDEQKRQAVYILYGPAIATSMLNETEQAEVQSTLDRIREALPPANVLQLFKGAILGLGFGLACALAAPSGSVPTLGWLV